MYEFTQTFPSPAERSLGKKNTCRYIILHHTGTDEWTTKWVLTGLNKTKDFASCHFLVNELWESYKMGQPTDVLWHAWKSARGKLRDMNTHSLWIEIIWVSWMDFSDECFDEVCKLVKHLRGAFNIPLENVLKHSDITQFQGASEKMLLRDWKRRARKVDLSPSFWQNRGYQNFVEFREKCLQWTTLG